jgi:RimJ/RimL family protein N-acetyltransferase
VAFTRLRLLRLGADVELGNAASEHILRNFGFRYVSREQIPRSGRVLVLDELSEAQWQREKTQR